MKFGIQIGRQAMRDLVGKVKPAFTPPNIIPILDTARLRWACNTVTLSLTNLDIQIDANAEAETFGDGAAQVPFKTLIWLSRMADSNLISLEFNEQNTMKTMVATTSSMTCQLNLLSEPQDFHELLEPKDGFEIIASQANLFRLISKGRHCISKDETRYYLNGTYLHDANGKACAATTDGHRLAKIESDIAWPQDAPGMIIPTDAVDAIRHILNIRANEPASLKFKDNRLSVSTDHWSIHVKLIDHKYPNYDLVIPKSDAISHVVINPAGLRPILTAPYGEFVASPIVFDTATKTASVKDDNENFSASICIEAQGEPMRIGFNRRYVSELVNSHGTLRLSLSNPGNPALIHSEDPAAIFVLMPMRT